MENVESKNDNMALVENVSSDINNNNETIKSDNNTNNVVGNVNSEYITSSNSSGSSGVSTATNSVNNSSDTSDIEKGNNSESSKNSNELNLYDNTENQKENDFIDFEKDEDFKNTADIFKESKISRKEYDAFLKRVLEPTTSEFFTKSLNETFKDQAQEEINIYRNATDKIFNTDEKVILNSLPAQAKLLIMKAVNNIAKENASIKKQYGIDNDNSTLATPQVTPENARREFETTTQKLLKHEYKSEAEYKDLMKRRLESAGKMGTNY